MSPRKTALVAGGTAGVGRAVVDALIADGYNVGVLARGQERLDALSDEYGARVMTLHCDVSDADRVSRAGAAVEEGLGPISVWVNCAMLTSFSPFPEMTPDEFERIVSATFLGQVNGTRTALALMQGRGAGRIVNVGSGLSYRAVPYQSAYCAAKHAINGFSDSIRSELIREGSNITLSTVQLPALNTPQFSWARNRLSQKPQPAPPIYAPQVAARAVMRAVRSGTRELFVGKSVMQLIFGHMIAPGWLDAKLADSGAEMQKSDQPEPGQRPDNLEQPVKDMPSTPEGRFTEDAAQSGWIVDAGRARLAVFAGVPAATFAAGLLLG